MKKQTSTTITRETLIDLYGNRKLSMQEIATHFDCSLNRIVYWMSKYDIARRVRSEAGYLHHNPTGDPFVIKPIKTISDAQLFGMGVGLYWGEGNKANTGSVRLGNTDPQLLIVFIRFLSELCGVDKSRLRFGLQIFTDIDPAEALKYWTTVLEVDISQFYKITVTISGAIGTYRKKSKYGVVTVYFNNKKLRDILVDYLPR